MLSVVYLIISLMSLSGERESLLTREIEDLKSKLGIVQRSETVRSNSKVFTCIPQHAACTRRL